MEKMITDQNKEMSQLMTKRGVGYWAGYGGAGWRSRGEEDNGRGQYGDLMEGNGDGVHQLLTVKRKHSSSMNIGKLDHS